MSGLIGVVLFLSFHHYLFPVDMVTITLDKEWAHLVAEAHLDELEIPYKHLSHKTLFQPLDQNFAFLKSQMGLADAKAFVRNQELNMGLWVVFWYEPNAPRDGRIIQVLVSPQGEIIGFRNGFTAPLNQSLDQQSAILKAQRFLEQYYSQQLPTTHLETTYSQREGRYQFTWFESLLSDPVVRMQYQLVITGRDISSFEKSLEIPESFQTAFQQETSFASMLSFIRIILAFMALLILCVLFLSKYHFGDIGMRYGAKVFWIILILGGLSTLNRIPTLSEGITFGQLSRTQTTILVLLFSIFFIVLATAVMSFLSWTVGESDSRKQDILRPRLKAIDALFNGRFFTKEIARSIFMGYSSCFIILGGLGLIAFFNANYLDGWTAWGFPQQGFQLFSSLTAYQVSLGILVGALSGALLGELLYRFFFLSFLTTRLKSVWLSVIISSLIFMVANLPGSFFPHWVNYVTSFLLGLLLCLLYLRSSLLANVIAMSLYFLASPTIMLLHSDHVLLWSQGLLLSGLALFPAVWGVLSWIRKEPFEFEAETTPIHIRRITERARISKELEIAKEVQLSMLPDETPSVEGFDIAGLCVPALEVGGDYFEYVPLSDHSLGLAIGDVSGKGVPAAIYMTLTKGVLLSYAQTAQDPKAVLTKVNQLMYRNMKRGHFVSMIYAILDSRSRKMTFVRAGHNPIVVIRNNQVHGEQIDSGGMALGLDSGPLFEATLQVRTLDVQPGDLLVFYTDGLSEAMNRNRDLFGEDNLIETISRYNCQAQASAKSILMAVFEDIKTFLGGEPQGDDMTMVIVKIGEPN